MITFTNIQRHDNVPFADYLKMPGYSQSYLKNEINGICPGVDVTDNMRFGSMVDSILTEPHKVDITDRLYDPGKEVASQINKMFGSVISKFQKQISYTGIAKYNHWQMPIKGRLDFLLPQHAVIDLKVTSVKLKQVWELINFMGYDKQLFNYEGLSEVKKSYLIIYSRPDRKSELFTFNTESAIPFWSAKIEKFGTLCKLV